MLSILLVIIIDKFFGIVGIVTIIQDIIMEGVGRGIIGASVSEPPLVDSTDALSRYNR